MMDGSLLMLVLIGIIYFIYYPIRSLAVDNARQELFAIRDAIFDMAVSGKISFESQEYKDLRGIINSFIRFAHRTNLTDPIIFIFVTSRWNTPIDDARTSKIIEKISSPEVNKEVAKYLSRVSSIMAGLALARSPHWLFVFLILRVINPKSYGNKKHWSAKVGKVIQKEAMILNF